jgi:hypothetical protein
LNYSNQNQGPDTIDFHVTGTINLTGALPNVVGDLNLAGPGADLLTVRRDTGGDYRIFSNSAATTISGLTIADGLAFADTSGELDGGGIYNGGNLTVDSCVIRNNQVHVTHDFGQPSAVGGGIYNAGTLTLIHSRVTDNQAYTEFTGGNSTGEFGKGGGIGNGGHLTILYSRVDGNTATSDDTSGLGSVALGGGLFNKTSGVLEVRFSSIDGNFAPAYYPAAAGGGLYNEGLASLGDSTVAGNKAKSDGGDARGGGIENQGILTVTNSTVAANISSESGGGIYTESAATLDVRDTIVGDNMAPFTPDLSGNLSGSGYNLFGQSAGGSGYDPTDLLDTDPLLGPLQDNGGLTQTMALLTGSPAIDSGDNANAPEWDQRGPGYPRIVNGTIDRGAFEVQNTGPGDGRSLLATAPLLPRALRTPLPEPAAAGHRQSTATSPAADVPGGTKPFSPVSPNAALLRAPVAGPGFQLLDWDWL